MAKNSTSWVKLAAYGLGMYGISKLLFRLFIIGWHMFLLKNPESTTDPFKLAATPAGVQDTCSASFREITTIHNVHTYEEVKRITAERNEPILFKGFAKDIDRRWEAIYNQSADVNVRFADVKITSFGNVFMKGIEVFGEVSMTLKEAVNMAVGDVKRDRSFFASFVEFLTKDGMKIALNTTNVDDIKVDTNFVSNFEDDVMGTHIHYALVHSHSLQLLGKKFWVFMSPDDFESFEPISTPTIWLLKGSEKEYFEKAKTVPIAISEPGDYLYFPPMWGHAVVTQAGPNIMLNMRKMMGPKILTARPMRALESYISVQLQDGGKIKPYSHSKYTPLQEKFNEFEQGHRNSNPGRKIPDSPCASMWKGWLKNGL